MRLDLGTQPVFQFCAQFFQIGLHIQSGADGKFSTVFVGNRRAKEGHQTVSGELVHHSIVFIDIIREHFCTTLYQLVQLLAIVDLFRKMGIA